MAEPKKRTNKSKTNMRRMHQKSSLPALEFCPQCHKAKIRHRLCLNCYTYRGNKVEIISSATKSQEEDNN